MRFPKWALLHQLEPTARNINVAHRANVKNVTKYHFNIFSCCCCRARLNKQTLHSGLHTR